MGYPLRSLLTNAFLTYREQIWLNRCALENRPLYRRRYGDDIFALFKSCDYLKRFKTHFILVMLTCHSLLKMNRKTKYYSLMKSDFSDLYTHFYSFLLDT